MINSRRGVSDVFMRVINYIIVFLGLMGFGDFIGRMIAKGLQVFIFSLNPFPVINIIELAVVIFGMIYFVRNYRK